jgi:2-dehydropantoate 2-reductase
LIINIAINPLTAIYQVNNGKLTEQKFQFKISTIIKEAFPVLCKQGINLTEKALLDIVNNVIAATADNYSSMNRDIFYNRATENEYINGYLIKKASQYNIEMPLIKSLYEQIKVLESHSLTAQYIH